MTKILVDTTVLLGWRSANDRYHDAASDIVAGIDEGDLPDGVVLTPILQELLKHVQGEMGKPEATRTLDSLVHSPNFEVVPLGEEVHEHGRMIWQLHDPLELPDALMVAYMRRRNIPFLYSFDGENSTRQKFERLQGVTRLNAAVDPY
jgi:hypothetical protein